MPLTSGSSEDTKAKNRKELWARYKATGKIGNTIPKSAAHARKIISAIVESTARGSKSATKSKR